MPTSTTPGKPGKPGESGAPGVVAESGASGAAGQPAPAPPPPRVQVQAPVPVRFASLAERPDLRPALLGMEAGWPAFIPSSPLLVDWALERHAADQLMALDGERVVARAATVPLTWDGDPANLPDTGWDAALGQSLVDTAQGHRLDTLCALEIAVVPGRRSERLSSRTLRALAEHARSRGYHDVVVPVRPSLKHTEPHVPMARYAARTRPDGLPVDPWLRVHVRAGGEVLKVCPASMTVSGSLAQWREWTGLPFTTAGPVEVPGALVPVLASPEHDHAVYVEPNVWVRHRLTPRAAAHP